MKKALVDADNRVVQIAAAGATFPVADPLRWVDCPDDVGRRYTYDPQAETFAGPSGPTLNDAKVSGLKAIDQQAEAARLRWITPGAGQALVYETKRREVAAYDAVVADGGTPSADDYPMLSAEVGITAADLDGVVDVVRALAAAWLTAAAAIEALRLAGKAAVNAATTVAEVDAATAITWPSPS